MSKINGKKVLKQNQLHDIVDWNIDNLMFADPEFGSVPDVATPISFVRINLLTQNHKKDDNGEIMMDDNGVPLNDDSIGEPIFSFDRMFSFGVSESVSPETKAVTGHTMSFAMWSREGANEREINTTKKIEAIVQKCKEHILNVKTSEPMKKIKKTKLEMSDLKDIDKILQWKEDDNGERVSGQGPFFSPKLIEYKARKDPKTGIDKPYQISTVFYLEDEVDENGCEIEVSPLQYLSTKTEKRYCYCRPAIKFESIFIGSKVISIQCKITEADIAPIQMGPQRLLHGRHKVVVNNKVSMNTSSDKNPLLTLNSAPSSEEAEEKKSPKQESEQVESTEVSGELVDDTHLEKSKTKKTTKNVSKKKVELSE